MPIGLVWFLISLCQGPEPLRDPVVVAWRPTDGHVLVLCDAGRRIRTFDPFLRPAEDRELPVVAAAAAGWGRAWLLKDAAGRVFDPLGRPATAPPDLPFEDGLDCAGPAGRRFTVEAGAGVLRRGLRAAEHAGEVEWGPGWAAVRFRSDRVLGADLEWRVDGEAAQRARYRLDPDDPLHQIAWLEPVAAGQRIELRHRPVRYRFPPVAWTEWVALEAPAVRAAGPRPVTVLPE